MSNEQDVVLIERREGYAVIRLNRPQKRNAMNRRARNALLDLLQAIRNEVSVCVLTGSENAFCAGIDLKERQSDRESGIETAPEEWRQVMVAIREHPAIFIAAVNGFALGGGVTLINACELAIAAKEARIGLPEMTFATYAGLAGPSTQLSLPRKRAAWMLLTARQINGTTAEAWGWVNQAVEPELLLSTAEELAAHVASFDPVALEETKRALDRIPHPIGDWGMALEHGSYVNATIRSRTAAQVEGVKRFGKP